MKKILVAGLVILTGLQAFAHQAANGSIPASSDPISAIPAIIKIKVVPSFGYAGAIDVPGSITIPGSATIAGPEVGEKLLQAFRESFPNAERVSWDELPNGYTVSFKENGILSRISYRKNGEFVGSLRYYTERYLPYYLVNVLKKRFPANKIFGVTEIVTLTDLIYLVKMEDTKYWTTVRIDSEGTTTVTERYQKAQ